MVVNLRKPNTKSQSSLGRLASGFLELAGFTALCYSHKKGGLRAVEMLGGVATHRAGGRGWERWNFNPQLRSHRAVRPRAFLGHLWQPIPRGDLWWCPLNRPVTSGGHQQSATVTADRWRCPFITARHWAGISGDYRSYRAMTKGHHVYDLCKVYKVGDFQTCHQFGSVWLYGKSFSRYCTIYNSLFTPMFG